ncbi:PP2C family protein-serine/threonine phosphatase [Streptomyces sp. NBC_01497]|uniref:PP2C family protein-serine/threonine phosphatase n=1 Tax=Streptomyces sp. NBC_01497 TaxID=2903885 RepID=UPI002E35950C|nr:PP2C family protein-serine/threonine phosphatase [Streptomyces sp. NBC_01497]
MTSSHDIASMLAGLLRESHSTNFDDLPALVERHAAAAGLGRVRILLADLQEDILRQVTGRGRDAGEGGQEMRIEGTLAGRAYQTIQEVTSPDLRQRWLPVLDGTARLGVLGIESGPGPVAQGTQGTQSVEAARALASAVGLLVVSKRANSDSYDRLTRVRTMNVVAEMQWTLMPPRFFANDRVRISAAMEPAYHIAGDAFDYALAGDVVHLALFDAMGHDIAAGLSASLAMAACRNKRRQDATVKEVSVAVDEVLGDQFGQEHYATGLLADVDLRTGAVTWVNRGHHPPVVVRGERWAASLECPPSHPMGTGLGLPVTVCHGQLEPGDRIIFYTDGIIEARDSAGNEFGLERFLDFIVRQHADQLPVAETLRRLIHAVLRHHEGRLDDDATVMVCEWLGPGDPVPPP